MIIYLLSIIIPIVVIVLEKIDNNIGEMVDSIIARIYLVLGNTKAAKNKLIKIVEKNPNSYIGHKLLGYIYEKEGGQILISVQNVLLAPVLDLLRAVRLQPHLPAAGYPHLCKYPQAQNPAVRSAAHQKDPPVRAAAYPGSRSQIRH